MRSSASHQFELFQESLREPVDLHAPPGCAGSVCESQCSFQHQTIGSTHRVMLHLVIRRDSESQLVAAQYRRQCAQSPTTSHCLVRFGLRPGRVGFESELPLFDPRRKV
jgi:hypothetical protein